MQSIDDQTGRKALAGFAGIEVRVLSDDLDESTKTGGRTRLVRFAAGAATTRTLVHDHWEEVYMLSGELRPASAADEGVTGFGLFVPPTQDAARAFPERQRMRFPEMQYYLPG